MDPELARQALIFQQASCNTPKVTIPALSLACLDDGQQHVATIPLADVYDGTCGITSTTTHDQKFRKAIVHTFTLKGRITDQDIVDNLIAAGDARTITAAEKVHAKVHISAIQNKNISSGDGWTLTWVTRETAWEDFKVLLFNIKLFIKQISQRTEGMTQATFDAHTRVAAELERCIAEAKRTCLSKIENEIQGVSDGTIPVFRSGERSGVDTATERRAKNREVERLEALSTNLEAWPESKFVGGPDDELPRPLLPLGKRSPSTRKDFFLDYAYCEEYLASANWAGVESFEFIRSLHNGPDFDFYNWKVQQFAHICDCAFKFLVLPRQIRHELLYSEELEYRMAMPPGIDNRYQREYFNSIKKYFDEYNSISNVAARSGRPPVGFQHMLINANVGLGGARSRPQVGAGSVSSAALAPLPPTAPAGPQRRRR